MAEPPNPLLIKYSIFFSKFPLCLCEANPPVSFIVPIFHSCQLRTNWLLAPTVIIEPFEHLTASFQPLLNQIRLSSTFGLISKSIFKPFGVLSRPISNPIRVFQSIQIMVSSYCQNWASWAPCCQLQTVIEPFRLSSTFGMTPKTNL